MSSKFQLFKTDSSLEKMINPETNEAIEVEVHKAFFSNEDGEITAAAAYVFDEFGNKRLIQHIGYAKDQGQE